MASSMKFSSTYPELSTPPHLQSGSSPTDCSPFAEADQAISELIRAMEHPTNVLDTSESAAPRPIRKTGLVFRGKPLAVNLLKPKRRRIAKLPKPQTFRFAKAAKRGTKAGRKGTIRNPQVDTARPSTRILDDGYDSDTRTE